MCKKSISIACHVVGTRYYSPPFSLSEKLKQKAPEFHLERQPDNIYDQNAIEVYLNHNKSLHQIGHIDRKTAAVIATQMDRGNKCSINLSGKGKIDWKGISVKLTLLSTGYHFGEKTPKISNKYNSGIYKIEIDDGKYWYVGQSSDIKERMKSHFRDLKFGVHGNHMIQNLWVSRKPENFRIKMLEKVEKGNLSESVFRTKLKNREEHYITTGKNKEGCLNIRDADIVFTKALLDELGPELAIVIEKNNDEIEKLNKELQEKIKQIKNIKNKIDDTFQKTQKTQYDISKNQEIIKENTGVRGFFKFNKDKNIVENAEMVVSKLKNKLGFLSDKLLKLDILDSGLEKDSSEIENGLIKLKTDYKNIKRKALEKALVSV